VAGNLHRDFSRYDTNFAVRRLCWFPMSQIRILLADDNPSLLSRVTTMLEKEFDIVSAVPTGGEALRECARLQPDVVVLDISMGEMNGIDVARRLRDSGSLARMVFLTVHEDPDFVGAAISAGGLAYVAKSRLATDLITGIKAALSGELFISPSLMYQR
jgi:DNA-binding NarL/FixJ family response regulator